jgi:hypothetical protein
VEKPDNTGELFSNAMIISACFAYELETGSETLTSPASLSYPEIGVKHVNDPKGL